MLDSDSWQATLEESLRRDQEYFRPELVAGLERVVTTLQKTRKVEEFGDRNITVRLKTADFDHNAGSIITSGFLQEFLAAVYFANAEYLERPVNPEQEKIVVVIEDGGNIDNRARYNISRRPYQHFVFLPTSYLTRLRILLRGLDAETRHAIHYNLMIDNDSLYQSCERVRLVISETIDYGIHVPQPSDNQLIDPFINDFDLKPHRYGHQGAEYICRLLSRDPEKLRMQLYWLAHLPIRKELLTTERIKQLKNQLVRFNVASPLGLPTRRGSVKARFSPYVIAPLLVAEFYKRKVRKTSPVIDTLAETRKNLRDYLPHLVDPRYAVVLEGRRIVRFASQLDYVALKLITQTPELLYAEAQQREAELRKVA